MTRNEILKEIKRFFNIEELVCDHVYARLGQRGWDFLDTNYLYCLLVIRRDILKKPMYCNGNNAHQRGLRCNMCQLVKEKKTAYLSMHIFGKAGDFTITGMTAEQARQMIKDNADLLPCPIRIEAGVSWLHFDTNNHTNQKVYEFTE